MPLQSWSDRAIPTDALVWIDWFSTFERERDALDQFVGHRIDGGRIGRIELEGRGKFVAAEPGAERGTRQCAHDPLADLAQQHIADMMAVEIVECI